MHCCLWAGPCVTVENVNLSQCLVMQRAVYEACQTASLCPFVWVVFFISLWGSWRFSMWLRHRDVYPYPCIGDALWTFMVLGARFSYVTFSSLKLRTRSDQTTRLSSSYCIMLFFVNAYNVTQYVGGKLSHPACAPNVCDTLRFKCRLESKLFTWVWKQSWSWVRNNWLGLSLQQN